MGNNDWDWDDNFPDGVFAVPRNPDEPKVKIRKLVDWCKANGIPPSEIHCLPKEVMEQFLVYPNEDRAKDEEKQD
ncbi:hypothetical protein [Alicyclobacillus mengziensis]|uniref:Uncharacterized protein n=1 Tax=Alicyclobacillus mengziensis TaxID=2931921 RepID=A0A9X7Z8P4_9BACL|nr:hypothetical protein [Alicyclobacillus mengziensis]QSO48635.1 hypothetical protein JZ786_06605 [Alicyclobacillus mengziensis]